MYRLNSHNLESLNYYMLESLTSQQLVRAARVKEKIEALEQELEELLGSTGAPRASGGAAGSRSISAAGKARIAAAQRARWAKAKNNSPANGTSVQTKRSGGMSRAARAKLAKSARERWAKAKAAGKTTL